MNIKIELAYDEIPAIRTLFAEYTKTLDVDLDFQNYEQELKHLPGKYSLPAGRLYTAYAEDHLAGCVALRQVDDEICEAKRLYVRPEYRGLKIGQMLMDQVIRDAAALKYRYMVLDSLETMDNAKALYYKLGFYEIGAYYQNPLANVSYMRLDL
jgi:Acetyltransferases